MIYVANPTPWLSFYAHPLHERVAAPPQELLDFLTEYNASEQLPYLPTAVAIDMAWQADVQEALEDLPQVLRQVLSKCLLGVFLVRGVGASGMTDMVALGDGSAPLGYFVVIDVEALEHRTANQWATWKENTAFKAEAGIRIGVCIADAEQDVRKNALRFLLLHEFGHLFSTATDVSPQAWKDPICPYAGEFAEISWQKNAQGFEVCRKDAFAQREQLRFYHQSQLHAAEAADVYAALAETAFPSLYASLDVQEDFAESFAIYVHTQHLHQPYRVTVDVADERVFSSDDFYQSPRARVKRSFFEGLWHVLQNDHTSQTFQGLAPFLRMSLNAPDYLRMRAQTVLIQANQDQNNAVLWMNLATNFLCLKMRELGLAIQSQALELQRLYVRPANCQLPKFRLLMIVTPGDLSENTPLDCLLENSPVELLYYYATPEQPLPSPLPAHDAVMVALSDSVENRPLLLALQARLAHWSCPVINPPYLLPQVNRDQLSQRLQGAFGTHIPRTYRLLRAQVQVLLDDPAVGKQSLAGQNYPYIIRPVGSQAGRQLARLDNSATLADYLNTVDSPEFFIAPFVDYSSDDGLYRKVRVAMLRGQPFVGHLAISSDWMVHYVNAGMYDSAEKRAEEGRFMRNFAQFCQRHAQALKDIYRRLGLDYFCIDCAETPDGKLLIFEIDHIMVVHAMDSKRLFPYKAAHIAKLQRGFEAFLDTLIPTVLEERA